MSVRSSASVPAASPAERIASASVAARRVKVTVSLSVPTDRALCRSYRPPRSSRSRSSITWRSSCNALRTCPGAWPRSQLSAMRALYLGPAGSAGDVFGYSGTVGTGRPRSLGCGDTPERTRSASVAKRSSWVVVFRWSLTFRRARSSAGQSTRPTPERSPVRTGPRPSASALGLQPPTLSRSRAFRRA